MTPILAIDPGPRESAYVELLGDRVWDKAKVPNGALLEMLRHREPTGPLVIEMMSSYGRVVGKTVFSTCVWVGRYLEAWRGVGRLLTRQEVKGALGLRRGTSATDADVRAELIRRWGGGRGKRQKAPPALAGVTKDMWAALAVAVAWQERHSEAFQAVEEAPMTGLEDLNRALGLDTGPRRWPTEEEVRDDDYAALSDEFAHYEREAEK